MKIYVKQLYDDKGNKIPVTLPTKGSELAAGYDIVATSDPKIVGAESKTGTSWIRIDYIEYETNLFISPSVSTYHTLIFPRSSISKYNLVLANSVGLIDFDYRGHILCRFKYIWQPTDFLIQNATLLDSPKSIRGFVNFEKIYKKGDKIAQLVFGPTVQAEFELIDELQATERGSGGFGSSDSKQGKPLTEVFSEEKKKFELKQGQPSPSILEKYRELGGVNPDVPYSEKIKHRVEP